MEKIDTVVIGGGQAGLAISYYLGCLRREHVIFERARVAERWRTQRWDTLMFQFPNWSIELPGRSYSGSDPNGFAHRDAVLHFIEDYCASIDAPIRTGVKVSALGPRSSSGFYEIVTENGSTWARNVVIATGPYQRSHLPSCSQDLTAAVVQVHASDYRSPGALPDGAVLVVGSGASGCQIADELLESGRQVYLSVGRHRRVPRRYRGQDVFWWRRELGELDQTVDTTPIVRRVTAPLVTGVHGGYDIDLRRSAANGMILLGHLRGISASKVAFASDLESSLRDGDQTYEDFEAAVDTFVDKSGLEVPIASSGGAHTSGLGPVQSFDELDIKTARIAAVIWATGYELDFSWVKLPLFDMHGIPVQYRGTTAAPGVYFLGLQWMYKLKSSFLYGVGEDAGYIASRICGERVQDAVHR